MQPLQNCLPIWRWQSLGCKPFYDVYNYIDYYLISSFFLLFHKQNIHELSNLFLNVVPVWLPTYGLILNYFLAGWYNFILELEKGEREIYIYRERDRGNRVRKREWMKGRERENEVARKWGIERKRERERTRYQDNEGGREVENSRCKDR